MDEIEPIPTLFKAVSFSKDESSWKSIKDVIHSLNQEAFNLSEEEHLLGEDDYITAYESTRQAFLAPETTVMLLQDHEKVIGYSLAMPIGKMNPDRMNENDQTAYIYFTALNKEVRGSGLVGQLTDKLFLQLFENGYLFVERDSVRKNGYADKIQRHFEKFPGSIVRMEDHEKFPEFGPERFFRIDLQSYLSQRGLREGNKRS